MGDGYRCVAGGRAGDRLTPALSRILVREGGPKCICLNQEVRNQTEADTLDQQRPLEIMGLSGFLGLKLSGRFGSPPRWVHRRRTPIHDPSRYYFPTSPEAWEGQLFFSFSTAWPYLAWHVVSDPLCSDPCPRIETSGFATSRFRTGLYPDIPQQTWSSHTGPLWGAVACFIFSFSIWVLSQVPAPSPTPAPDRQNQQLSIGVYPQIRLQHASDPSRPK